MSSACLQVISAADPLNIKNQTGNKIQMDFNPNPIKSSMWQNAWNILCDIHGDDINGSLTVSSFLSNALTQMCASKALSEATLHLLWW